MKHVQDPEALAQVEDHDPLAGSMQDFWKEYSSNPVDQNGQMIRQSNQPPAHQAFKQMKRYITERLEQATVTTFNGMCEVLLNPMQGDIAPLLKHYDSMNRYTHLKMPSEAMLRLDQ